MLWGPRAVELHVRIPHIFSPGRGTWVHSKKDILKVHRQVHTLKETHEDLFQESRCDPTGKKAEGALAPSHWPLFPRITGKTHLAALPSQLTHPLPDFPRPLCAAVLTDLLSFAHRRRPASPGCAMGAYSRLLSLYPPPGHRGAQAVSGAAGASSAATLPHSERRGSRGCQGHPRCVPLLMGTCCGCLASCWVRAGAGSEMTKAGP